MKERPINLAAWEVRAFLAGRKTRITRPVVFRDEIDDAHRVVAYGDGHSGVGLYVADDEYQDEGSVFVLCPFGVPGDRLWCRECWCDIRGGGFGSDAAYRADSLRKDGREDCDAVRAREDYGYRWASSSTMPRWASRIWRDVVGVRAERVQDISRDDLRADGLVDARGPLAEYGQAPTLQTQFGAVWDARYGKRFPWSSNPWVWVGDVRRTEA